MTKRQHTATPYRWSTLERLPWPNSNSFEAAKREIRIRAKELPKLTLKESKPQRDTYAAEFVSNNKTWIPQDRQTWTKACISRLLYETYIERSKRAYHKTKSANLKIQDRSVADGPGDGDQPMPSPVLSQNNHEANKHKDNNHEGNIQPDNNQVDNETDSMADDVHYHTRSTSASCNPVETDGFTPIDKFSPEALKQYTIRLDILVNGNSRPIKRVLLWLCGDGGTKRSSLIDIGDLSFDKLARLANLSEIKTITYAYARSPTAYMQIRDDADFITAVQHLINQNASPVDDLVLCIQEA